MKWQFLILCMSVILSFQNLELSALDDPESEWGSVLADYVRVTTDDLNLLQKKVARLGIEEARDFPKISVHFVPQIHGSPFRLDRATDLEKVAGRQIRIARLLKKNPELPVFVEGLWLPELTQDIFQRTISSQELEDIKNELRRQLIERVQFIFGDKNILDIFPNGIPDREEDLNDEQMRALAYVCGAAGVLFLLNEIRNVYPTENSVLRSFGRSLMEDLQLNWFNGSRRLYERLGRVNFDERETNALAYVLMFSKALDLKGSMLLIFGEAHHFDEYSQTGYPVVSASTISGKLELAGQGEFIKEEVDMEFIDPIDNREHLQDLLDFIGER